MSVDYKDTLNLPNTAFPMKANLANREPETLKFWDSIDLYSLLQEHGQKKQKFILADGPPFANGPIHIGHAVNKILKDFVLKSKTLSGYCAPYVPGWDCHGLPVELNVEKQVGKPGVKVDAKAFRQKCRDYVLTQVDLQCNAFIRLGVLGDWKNPYKTMDFRYEADIIRSLAKIVENGHLQKGFKPVHWCVDCGSSLAEAEVEYQEKTSPAVDVAFPMVDKRFAKVFKEKGNMDADFPLAGQEFEEFLKEKGSVVIWTTTLWTLPANEAVALGPNIIYDLIVEKNSSNHFHKMYLVAEELEDRFASRIGWENSPEPIATVLGKDLEGLYVQHPFYDKEVPIVLGDHVTLEDGTGCVHTAPAHGQEDYLVGQKYNLPLINPVGSDGCYISTTPLLAGIHVLKANDKVIEILKGQGNLVFAAKIQHSYPHCWRHKAPLIFRATQQWFVSMEQKDLRSNAMTAIETVQWLPSWGRARIEGMVKDRPDWCISRQRTWGVPMAFIVHKETGQLHPNILALMEETAKHVEKSGLDAWYDLSVEDLIKEDAEHYEKTTDSLDVWFDSGVAHYCVLDIRKELEFPADLYLEGSDQHRGWFQSSLLTSVAMRNKAPYRQVLTHGFTVDTDGRKMSKSLGNVVAPDKVISNLGADVLRLWVSQTDYRTEMAVSDEILKRTSDIYRRIRNTARFLLANLNGFDAKNHLVKHQDLLALDRWMVERAAALQSEIHQAYEEYQFHIIYQKIHHFCSVDLGSFYLDIIKDRQYTGKKEGLPRRSAQTVMFHTIEALVRWMAPILCFTAEEIWQNIPGEVRAKSVFLSEWYTDFGIEINTAAAMQNGMDDQFWQNLILMRDEVNKVLEEARNGGIIGSGLEAEVDLYCDTATFEQLAKLENELRFVLITSRANIHPASARTEDAKATAFPGLWVKVGSSVHPKCVRCWHRREDVNQNGQYPEICARCMDNVAGEGEVRHFA